MRSRRRRAAAAAAVAVEVRPHRCGSSCAGLIVAIGTVIWLCSGPEGGVRLTNEMDKYALEYIQKHKLLEPGEGILAYYDATISMDGRGGHLTTAVLYTRRQHGGIPLAQIKAWTTATRA